MVLLNIKTNLYQNSPIIWCCCPLIHTAVKHSVSLLSYIDECSVAERVTPGLIRMLSALSQSSCCFCRVAPIVCGFFLYLVLFCIAVLSVISSFAIISRRTRQQVGLLKIVFLLSCGGTSSSWWLIWVCTVLSHKMDARLIWNYF